MYFKKMLKILQINYQGSNIKGFSLLEFIITIILIVLITSFAIPKYNAITYNSNLSVLKSDLSLIQNSIAQSKTKNILLSNNEKIENLDDSSSDKISEKLFTNVIDFSILSTDSKEKKAGKWNKTSDKSYEFYLSSSKSILFLFEDEKLVCKSEEELCKEIR
jgi:type II secretory pathway pseudopilin PulG